MSADYRELAPPRGLADQVACVWASHDRAVRVLPDACVDVVLDGERLIVAGPATRPVVAPATPGLPRAGIRFRIGAAGPALGVPADALRDRAVPLTELWGAAGRRAQDRVLLAADPLAALVAELGPRLREGADPVVRAAAQALARPGTRVEEAAGRAGLGERHLRRRFAAVTGYGPATFVRVQRFQRFLALAAGAAGPSLARLAAEAGYADQAHLARECRALAELPPTALLAEGAVAAGDKSV